ncbi:MAG TPA: tetratricopeptide repeat protein [Candidatus Dormibacteraeota bacterium]|nr:tetratricopeptide repeat protein [Candidatus Dormibacteraeota bacterium]
MRGSPDKSDLLERYEATGDEAAYLEALPLYEQAAASGGDVGDLLGYGYLLQCRGRDLLKLAITQYERAIALDPADDKPRYQLISARAALGDVDREISVYLDRLAAEPKSVREHRLLATAYLASREYDRALEVIDRGLALAPNDRRLIDCRAEARSRRDPEGALADWRRALELDSDDIGPLYMSAFLLERLGRLEESIDTWQAIIDWNEARGYKLQTKWPMKEVKRLELKRDER